MGRKLRIGLWRSVAIEAALPSFGSPTNYCRDEHIARFNFSHESVCGDRLRVDQVSRDSDFPPICRDGPNPNH